VEEAMHRISYIALNPTGMSRLGFGAAICFFGQSD
jgi:hypothetical protein